MRSDHSRKPPARARPPRAAAVTARRRRRRGAAVAALLAGAIAAAGAVAAAPSSDRHAGGDAPPRATPGASAAATPPVAAVSTAAARLRLEVLRAGSGVRSAEIVRPRGGGDLPGVVFLHGWGLVARSDYRPWIRHLAREGNQVIVPRYQRDEHSDPGRALADALAGIRAAFRRAPGARTSLVAAGHSAGGALAADYAASARARKLPRPVAVFSVYPGRKILGYPNGIPEIDPARIAPGTWLTAMAGANDVVVAQAPAQTLIRDATGVSPRRKRYVLVRTPSVADHYGPTRATRTTRRVFWARLDRLIARARPSG